MASTTILSCRHRVHEILVAAPAGGGAGLVLQAAIKLLIGLNVLAVVLESVPSLEEPHAKAFQAFEVVQTAELLGRALAEKG